MESVVDSAIAAIVPPAGGYEEERDDRSGA